MYYTFLDGILKIHMKKHENNFWSKLREEFVNFMSSLKNFMIWVSWISPKEE